MQRIQDWNINDEPHDFTSLGVEDFGYVLLRGVVVGPVGKTPNRNVHECLKMDRKEEACVHLSAKVFLNPKIYHFQLRSFWLIGTGLEAPPWQ
jgi:hypothetical protein